MATIFFEKIMGKSWSVCHLLAPKERFSKGIFALLVKKLDILCSFCLIVVFLGTIETLVTSKSVKKKPKGGGRGPK